MDSDSRKTDKDEVKPVQGSNERPKSLDLDSSSRGSLSNINDKKEKEKNETTRLAYT
jgi:hypothetical protein